MLFLIALLYSCSTHESDCFAIAENFENTPQKGFCSGEGYIVEFETSPYIARTTNIDIESTLISTSNTSNPLYEK
jgi:hypothetical protein